MNRLPVDRSALKKYPSATFVGDHIVLTAIAIVVACDANKTTSVDLIAMDLTSVEAAAAHAKNAAVVIGLGGIVVSFRLWYFARTEQIDKRHGAMLAAALMAVLQLMALTFVHIYTEELTNLLKVEIATAGARAAEANERAVTLETANLELRKQVGTLEKSNLSAFKEMAGLQIEVANARRRQADAETRLAKVVTTLEPRHLRMAMNREQMVKSLKGAPSHKVVILYQETSPESSFFAYTLQSVLLDAGWKSVQARPVPSTTVYGATLGDIFFSGSECGGSIVVGAIRVLQFPIQSTEGVSVCGWRRKY